MDNRIHEGDFYEDDEPFEDIVAAWEQSTSGGVTSSPESLTQRLSPDIRFTNLMFSAAGNALTPQSNSRTTDPAYA